MHDRRSSQNSPQLIKKLKVNNKLNYLLHFDFTYFHHCFIHSAVLTCISVAVAVILTFTVLLCFKCCKCSSNSCILFIFLFSCFLPFLKVFHFLSTLYLSLAPFPFKKIKSIYFSGTTIIFFLFSVQQFETFTGSYYWIIFGNFHLQTF